MDKAEDAAGAPAVALPDQPYARLLTAPPAGEQAEKHVGGQLSSLSLDQQVTSPGAADLAVQEDRSRFNAAGEADAAEQRDRLQASCRTAVDGGQQQAGGAASAAHAPVHTALDGNHLVTAACEHGPDSSLPDFTIPIGPGQGEDDDSGDSIPDIDTGTESDE
jgi:hypothetical protein